MSIGIVTIILFGGLLILMAAGIPVAFSLACISVIVTLIIGNLNDLYMVVATVYRETTNIGLIAIPLFVLMGNFLVHSGVSDRLFNALNYWLSGFRGGLAIVTIIVCVALAMCGGFGPGIVTMGLVAVPAMLKHSYHRSLALGSVMAGGVLACVIPPSIIMIVFAYIARVSIGRLFFGGAVPGLICAAGYIIYIVITCYLKPQIAPNPKEEINWKIRVSALKEIVLPVLLVVMVLGSIFGGICTPSEAAGVGAFGAFLICIIHRRLTLEVIRKTASETMKVSGMVLWILIAATLFGVVYTSAGAQGMVMDIVKNFEGNRWAVLITMQVLLMIFGMFMDDYAVITVCAPIFVPMAKVLGFDVIWFSVLFILNMQVAYLTPPFGWALILTKAIAPPDVSTKDVWRAVPPFVIIQLVVLILAMVFPQLILWLPTKMF